MFCLPIGAFYFLLYVVFDGNKDYLAVCGIGAVIAANFVIGSYVKMAWEEDGPGSSERAIKVD
jgi:hypothetical protein